MSCKHPRGENVDVDDGIDEVEKLFKNDSDGTSQKARSIFWTEVMDEVKKKGSRAVVGVRGQFANFEKTQPGYYGEQGSVIKPFSTRFLRLFSILPEFYF